MFRVPRRWHTGWHSWGRNAGAAGPEQLMETGFRFHLETPGGTQHSHALTPISPPRVPNGMFEETWETLHPHPPSSPMAKTHGPRV